MKLQIHVYDSRNVSLEDLLSSRYLSTLEKSSFEKYKNLETKKEKIVSSIFKNKYIGDYHLNEFSKPVSDNTYFNISHSHGMVAFIKDNIPVGLDIEKIREAKDDIKDFISNEEEKRYIHDDQSFFEVWTNKEALVKALGTGFKSKIKDVPGLPLNGLRLFEDKKYYNKTIIHDDYVITVSRQSDEDFDLEVIKEVIWYG